MTQQITQRPAQKARQAAKANAPYIKTARGTVPFSAAQLPGLPSFLNGNLEEIVMTNTPKVTITWMHTNEDHAPAVAHELYTKHPELAKHVNYICGNPLTARTTPEKGFTENDLNRSFGAYTLAHPKTYEDHRAVEVMKFIHNSEFVLDPHNTVCPNFGAILIVKDGFLNEPKMRAIIAASPLKRIMLMPPKVSDLCLNGEPHAKTMTFEYELNMTKTHAVPDTIATIKALVTGKNTQKPFEREVFRVTGAIPKSEDPGLHVKNFEPFVGKDGRTHHAAFLGTGPRSYREDPTKDYCGYYATLEHMII